MAKLYGVPSWVFISDSLPEQYAYIQKASFRQFKDSEAYEDSNVRRLVVKIERYRDLFIEMQCDIDELVAFRAPKVNRRDPILKTAKVVREWLDMDTPLDHLQIREKLERKGIFVFFTSKYNGWSRIERDGFRGLCLQHTTTPIIIVNDSDSKKAQSFTLIHELGHLLLSSDSIDSWQKGDSDGEEQWCDKLAGYVLMPDSELEAIKSDADQLNFGRIQLFADKAMVSPYALLVRLKIADIINQEHITL